MYGMDTHTADHFLVGHAKKKVHHYQFIAIMFYIYNIILHTIRDLNIHYF